MYPEVVKQYPSDPRSISVMAVFTIDPYTGLPVTGGGGGGGTTYDYEMRTIEFIATANGTGYSTNDRLVLTDVVNVLNVPSVVVSTMWFNATTLLALSAAPPAANVTMIAPGSGGGGTVGGSLEVTQLLIKAGIDSLVAVLGTTNDAAATTDTGAFSIPSLIKRALTQFTTLLTRVPTLGQKNKAASTPVTLASDQEALPLAATASTSTLQTAANALLTSIDGKIIAAPATSAKQDTLITAVGAVTTKLSADPSTGAKQDAIIAKMIAAPATAALQTAGNVSLASIDTKTPALETGRVPVAPPNTPVGFDNLPQVMGYDGTGNLTTITATNGTNTWVQTLSYTSGNLTGVSAWVLQ